MPRVCPTGERFGIPRLNCGIGLWQSMFRALYLDPGNDQDHASGGSRRIDRQYRQRLSLWQCPFSHGVCDFQGRFMTLTKNVAYSIMRHRIRINMLNIGWMDTPGENIIQHKYHNAGDDWLENAETGMPFGRLLKPQEVASAVAFMASEKSGMMTGSIVDFDQSVQGAGSQPIPPADAA